MPSILFRYHNVFNIGKSLFCKPNVSIKNITKFHTTNFQKTSKQLKKSKNIIQYKPKSKQPIIQLWRGITPLEIADAVKRDIDDIFEAISYIEDGDCCQDPDFEIYDNLSVLAIAKRLGYRVEFIKNPSELHSKVKKNKDLVKRPPPDPSVLVKRPPVVTIMGHVDHGKTTLLDALRHSSIVAQEHGGITQHIGAFTVKVPQGNITVLDTPGHAAFYTMRARGAHVTDLVILVVAVDDGIMEQTIESIRFAKEANVPIIVAINKIDKPECDIDSVKQGLLSYGLQVEDLGGEIQVIPISALKRINLDLLIEAILTQAEIMDITGDSSGPVEGVVLEASIDTSKGKISTALIQRGTLKKGVCLVAGTASAKVRSMFDDNGKVIQKVTPGTPVQIIGWKSFPAAGEIILEATSEKHVHEVVKFRENKVKEEKMASDQVIIQKKMEIHFSKYREERLARLMRGRYRKEKSYFREKESFIDTHPTFSFVIKGDVHGSVEAILDVVNTYKSHDACDLDIIHSGIGNITENDITLAETFNGIIYTFNIDVSSDMKKLATEKNIIIKPFNVIYHLIDDMKIEISNRLPLVQEEDILGEAIVLQQFMINDGKMKVPVAGCKCTKGFLKKNGLCKVIRSEKVLYNGPVLSLRHEKSSVETIKKDVECGLMIENSEILFLPGDAIICYNPKSVSQVTDWNPGF